jgi:uncharacterized protein YdeI (BOF family)
MWKQIVVVATLMSLLASTVAQTGSRMKSANNLQYQGDKAAADRFIDQYTTWDESLHGAIAKNIRDQQRYRFRLFKYAALGE